MLSMRPPTGSKKPYKGSNMTLSDLRKEADLSLPKELQDFDRLVPYTAEKLDVLKEIAPLFPHLNTQVIKFKVGEKQTLPPIRVGVVLSGGQAAGGHNVIVGLFRGLKKLNTQSELIGFLDGPAGIINNKTKLLTEDFVNAFFNQGGFDMIGSGRDKIETPEQFESSLKSAQDLKLDGIVVIGGDDSNTNAALLAEYFKSKNQPTTVVGVPKTIDGDLKNKYIETSFGFDTACKTYSEMIGNILKDTLSAKKYWYFIKLMGRSASHITLECALQTHPNLTLIAEERESLDTIVSRIVKLIEAKPYGAILIPEGIIEFIPEMQDLIQALNKEASPAKLEPKLLSLFKSLPDTIQKQLTMDRDPHGNVQVSKIDTERFFIELVQAKTKKKFSPQPLFFGYEGRSAFPSNFDAEYCYALGFTSALLVAHKASGLIASVSNLKNNVAEWKIAGVPLIAMMDLEVRKGKMKPVITKALVDINSPFYKKFKEESQAWALKDDYQSPGPIQFFGPKELVERRNYTLEG